MVPKKGPFGIGKFRSYKDWLPYFKIFSTCAKFFFRFDVFDFQEDGFMYITLCLWYRAFQVQLPFPGSKIKYRTSLRFPKKQLLSIQEPK